MLRAISRRGAACLYSPRLPRKSTWVLANPPKTLPKRNERAENWAAPIMGTSPPPPLSQTTTSNFHSFIDGIGGIPHSQLERLPNFRAAPILLLPRTNEDPIFPHPRSRSRTKIHLYISAIRCSFERCSVGPKSFLSAARVPCLYST